MFDYGHHVAFSCRNGVAKPVTKPVPIVSPSIPVGSSAATTQQNKPEKEPNFLMRHVVIDQKVLQAIVDHADEYVLVPACPYFATWGM